MNGIMTLKKGGRYSSYKGKEEKRQKTKKAKQKRDRQDDNRENYKAKRVQDSLNEKKNRINKAQETRTRILQEAKDARSKGEKYVIDPELFTQNKAGTSNTDDTGKLREGMKGGEYAEFMRKLHGANPAAMQKAFPWSSGKALGNIAKMALPAPIKFGLGALKKFGQLKPVKNLRTMGRDVRDFAGQFVPEELRTMGRDFKNLGLGALRTAGQLGPVKELTKMFGLDGLNSKLVGIAGNETTKQFNDIIKGQQAYDPSGLEGYKDEIFKHLPNQATKNTFGDEVDENVDPNYWSSYTLPLQYPDTGQSEALSPAEQGGWSWNNPPEHGFDENYEIQRDPTQVNLNDKIDYLNTRFSSQDLDFSKVPPSTIDSAYEYYQRVENKEEAFNREERDPGVIDLTPRDEIFEDVSETEYDTSGLRRQIDMNTEQGDIFTNNAFMGDETFPAGGVGNNTNFDTGNIFNSGSYPKMNIFGNEVGGPRHHILNQINKYGNASSASEKEYFDILNSLGQANGGYMSSFPHQNMGTQSLTASDNIDDRIMKNLQYEKMAPGMMGYNQGGKVMSTFEKLKAIADNNYG